MNIIEIKQCPNSYPERIEGTNEWFSCYDSQMALLDLYEAEEIVKMGNRFTGLTQHLVHFPDGKVYSPFSVQENVYVERPIFEKGIFYFLSVDFSKEIAQIIAYTPDGGETSLIAQVSLDEIEDCYNLKLEVSPLTLGRSDREGTYEIIWPEKRKIALGEYESVCFREGNKLYCSRWGEEPEYHECLIVRDIETGEILEEEEGSLLRMADGVYWKF